MILENNANFNILFIQEPSWLIICQILSSISKEEKNIIRALYYPSWIIFTRLLINNNDYPRVNIYINVKLIKLHLKNIFNHWDINLIVML